MQKITASGVRNGVKMTIEVIDGLVFIDAVEEDAYNPAIQEQHPIGGTFFFEKESMENMLHTLTYHFFDSPPRIVTEGVFEEVPFEEDKLY